MRIAKMASNKIRKEFQVNTIKLRVEGFWFFLKSWKVLMTHLFYFYWRMKIDFGEDFMMNWKSF